ncbi:ABC transporter permease [Bacillus sp. 1P02SD]|uniref:ABC transporter permease n=1 Tax=Bacillus sp. 1P02SD TaxID=3132264 RepID=UPI0039A15EF8
MLTYIIRRLLMLIPMVIIVSFLIYGGMELMPGDTISFIAGPDAMANLSPEKLDALRESLGLNDPFIVRYFNWFVGILQGNFGYSLTSGTPIEEIVLSRLPATLQLSFIAIIFSLIIGSIFGLISALKRGTIADNSLTVMGMIGLSIPEFFFGLVFLLIFAIDLQWFPVSGRMLPGQDGFLDRIPHLVLPSLVLGIAMIAGVMRYSRSSMLDAINKDFIRTARSKGIPEWRVNLVHGFRVALTPVAVLVGFRLPMLIGGTVVIEQIFQWPGVGSEFLSAIQGQNYPLVMMIALLFVLIVLLSSFLVDIVTALLDPRVRLG